MTEEPCQCPDCQRFYKEHDRLIREFPTFKQQQELNWASIQSFRTLCGKVTEELEKQLSEKDIKNKLNKDIKEDQIITWKDVDYSSDDPTVSFRRSMEKNFRSSLD